MTDQQSNNIIVQIYGTEYSIKGESDVEYMQDIAHYIDQKMHDVQKNTAIKSALKVSILAALNIVDELFHEREKNKIVTEELEHRIQKLTELVNSFENNE